MNKITALWSFSVLIDRFGDILFENSQWVLGDLFFAEILRDNVLNDFLNFEVSFRKVFVKLVSNHLFKLFSLLNRLCFLNGWMDLTAFLWTLGFCLILDVFGHGLFILSYIFFVINFILSGNIEIGFCHFIANKVFLNECKKEKMFFRFNSTEKVNFIFSTHF